MIEYVFVGYCIYFEEEGEVHCICSESLETVPSTISLPNFRGWEQRYPNDLRVMANSIEEAIAIRDLLT